MSELPLISALVGGPVLGALSALVLGYTRPWQIIGGAILGEGVGYVAGRAWSEHVAAEAMRSGRNYVVVRATGLTWRDHLITVTVFVAFAVLIGGLVALIKRLAFDGRD